MEAPCTSGRGRHLGRCPQPGCGPQPWAAAIRWRSSSSMNAIGGGMGFPACPCRLRSPLRRPSVAHRLSTQPTASAAAPAVQEGVAAGDPGGGVQRAQPRVSQFVREAKPTYAAPAITATGSLRPRAEWYPAWMRYRRREDNYVFWQDKFSRNSTDIAYEEKRWTLFSTFWFLAQQTRFYAIPPAVRFLVYLGWRAVMERVYEAHKQLILLQCQLEAYLAAHAIGVALEPMWPWQRRPRAERGREAADAAYPAPEPGVGNGQPEAAQPGTVGQLPGFSRAMALRRLHWRNSLVAELLYLLNVFKTGRTHLLPPTKRGFQRPTFFWLF